MWMRRDTRNANKKIRPEADGEDQDFIYFYCIALLLVLVTCNIVEDSLRKTTKGRNKSADPSGHRCILQAFPCSALAGGGERTE